MQFSWNLVCLAASEGSFDGAGGFGGGDADGFNQQHQVDQIFGTRVGTIGPRKCVGMDFLGELLCLGNG